MKVKSLTRCWLSREVTITIRVSVAPAPGIEAVPVAFLLFRQPCFRETVL